MYEESIRTSFGRTTVYYNDSKHENRITTICLHGGPGYPNPSMVDHCSDHCMMTYDQRGNHGHDQSKDSNEYCPEVFIDELNEIIETLRIKDFILYGVSWGTALACGYIEKYGTDGLKGLILSAPALDMKVLENDRIRIERSLPEHISKELERCYDTDDDGEEFSLAMRAFFIENYNRNEDTRFADWCFNQHSEIYETMWGPSELRCTGTMKDMDYSKNLKDIDVPTLIISGEYDTDIDVLRSYSDIIPECELKIIRGRGHFISGAEEYRIAISDFIKEIWMRNGFANSLKEPKYEYGPILEDYDIILDPDCTMKTLIQLERIASSMTIDECFSEGMRHETGDGMERSIFSADVFYIAAKNKYIGSRRYRRPLQTKYDVLDPDKKLLCARHLEATCCDDIRDAISRRSVYYNGHDLIMRRITQNDDGKREEVIEKLDKCPYCDCPVTKITCINASETYKGKTSAELESLSESFRKDRSIESQILSVDLGMMAYDVRMKDFEGTEIAAAIKRIDKAIKEHSMEMMKNITGTLTRSSVGFESICCKEFSEKFEIHRDDVWSFEGEDVFYSYAKFKDNPPQAMPTLRACPYCNARLKRVPRHY